MENKEIKMLKYDSIQILYIRILTIRNKSATVQDWYYFHYILTTVDG